MSLLLFLYGLLIFFVGAFRFGIGVSSSLLTLTTLTALITAFFNKRIGWTILFISVVCWLLRYFEHASYLIFYDQPLSERWPLVLIPIVLAFTLFTLLYKAYRDLQGRPFRLRFVSLSLLVFLSIGLLSFVRKSHVKEFNCWYYFDNSRNDFKILFALSPDQKFQVRSSSDELKEVVKRHGMTDPFREGYYCPETKVEVITRFKEVITVKILGFHNTQINKVIQLEDPVVLDVNLLKGNNNLLEPEFTLGD